jgi:TRAP-type uncharacterized transport system fused permease subunit
MEVESEFPEPGQRDWRIIYNHLKERHAYHVKSVVRRTVRYKRMAAALHILIPLISLVLTILATSDFPHQHAVTGATAIALTVLTGINYTLEPSKRYQAYAEISIQLHDLMFEIEGEVEKFSEGTDIKLLIDYLEQKNKEFSTIARAMAGLPVPREQLG